MSEGGTPRSPLLVVDLDGETGDLDAAVRAAEADDRVLVGSSRRVARVDARLLPLIRSLDLTVGVFPEDDAGLAVIAVPDVPAAERALAAAVEGNPHASLLLVHLLRWSGTLSVRDALDAESLAYSTLMGGPEFRRWLAERGPRPLPPPAPDAVLAERIGDELHITLNRPDRRNAYGRELRDALVAALDVALWDDSVTRVRLDGAGPVFCSGGDLDEFGTTPDLVTAHLVRTRGGAAVPLHRLADRVEVRLHGACVGAGIELPAYAGRIVAAPDTRVRLPEVAMGLIPGAGGTVSLPRRIGRWRTSYLALTGEWLTVDRALSWGLVDGMGDHGPAGEFLH